MSDASEPRFVIRLPGGDEVRLGSVEELQAAIAGGDVPSEAELFDGSTRRWSPVREAPVFRFIVEELEAEGRLPETLRGLAEGRGDEEHPGEREEQPSGVDDWSTMGRDEVTEKPLEGPTDPASGDVPREPDSDPFDLHLDLVDDEESAGPDQPASAIRPPIDDDPRAARRPSGFVAGDDEVFDPDPRSEAGRDRDGDEDEEDWFTPASEGGMVLPDPEARGQDESGSSDVEVWRPEEGEEVPPSRPAGVRGARSARPRLVAAVCVLGVAAAGWLYAASGGESDEDTELEAAAAVVELPAERPFPPGLEASGTRVLSGVGTAFLTIGDSLRAELDLGATPPEPWLSGFYLANAGRFPEVVRFWETYVEFLEIMRARDRAVYLDAVDRALSEEGLESDAREGLATYFSRRYEERAPFVRSRYDLLEATADAALRLHGVLVRHEGEIVHSPALGSGVSADPIMEAVIPEGPIRRDVEEALDRVFRALDRSRGGGAPSGDGLRTELFSSLGAFR